MNKWISGWVIICISCTHAPAQKFERHLQALQCEEALQAVPELQRSGKALTSAEWAATSTVSYSYVGLNYTAQVLWNVGVGTLVLVTICAPAALAVSSGGGSANFMCLPVKFPEKVWAPPMGKNAWKDTRDLRCPNVDPLALSLEKVASCYEKRNTPEDRVRAETTMANIESSKYFFSCASPEIQTRISDKRLELQKQLN